LLVVVFTHSSLQVYLERITHGQFSGSYWAFLPHYFEGMYGFGGNFAWMGLHLWYLEALFIFSMLCLPVFLWLKNSLSGQRLLQGLGNFLAKPGAAYLLALPAIILIIVLDPDSWGTDVFGGWSMFIYLSFFVSGFVIASNERLQASIVRWRWISLAAGILLRPVVLGLWAAFGEPGFGTLGRGIVMVPYCLNAWCLLLAIFGFGMKHLNVNTPLLKYANEAVLPFYILHQTVIVTLGFFVVQWAIPDLLKFLIILSGSFVIVMCLYEFLVRRFNLLRFLFGMKPKQRSSMDVRSVLARQGV
jgi:hypothetical protein